jgi:hypothetical protein
VIDLNDELQKRVNEDTLAWMAFNTLVNGSCGCTVISDQHRLSRKQLCELIAYNANLCRSFYCSHYLKVNGDERMIMFKTHLGNNELLQAVVNSCKLNIAELKVLIPKIVNELTEIFPILIRSQLYGCKDFKKKLKTLKLGSDVEDKFFALLLMHKITR